MFCTPTTYARSSAEIIVMKSKYSSIEGSVQCVPLNHARVFFHATPFTYENQSFASMKQHINAG